MPVIPRSTLAHDGAAIVQPAPLFEWMIRSLLMLNRHILQQMPQPYQIEIDSEMFLKSMSFVDEGVRQHGTAWEHAPHDAVHKPATEEASGTTLFMYPSDTNPCT